MENYSYKPALLRGATTYEVTPNALVSRTSQGGENWRLPWEAVDKAAFVQTNLGGYQLRRLDLLTSKEIRSISYNGGKGAQVFNSDSVTHLNLMAAILRRLEIKSPDFPVTIGEHGRAKTLMFAIGVLTCLLGLGMSGLAIGTGVANNKLIEAAGPMLILIAFGGYIAHRNAPWRALLTVPAGTLAKGLHVQDPSQDTQGPAT